MKDALYFIEHYCKFKTDTGRKIVKLLIRKKLCHILGRDIGRRNACVEMLF